MQAPPGAEQLHSLPWPALRHPPAILQSCAPAPLSPSGSAMLSSGTAGEVRGPSTQGCDVSSVQLLDATKGRSTPRGRQLLLWRAPPHSTKAPHTLVHANAPTTALTGAALDDVADDVHRGGVGCLAALLPREDSLHQLLAGGNGLLFARQLLGVQHIDVVACGPVVRATGRRAPLASPTDTVQKAAEQWHLEIGGHGTRCLLLSPGMRRHKARVRCRQASGARLAAGLVPADEGA